MQCDNGGKLVLLLCVIWHFFRLKCVATPRYSVNSIGKFCCFRTPAQRLHGALLWNGIYTVDGNMETYLQNVLRIT
jgi:hypothetical protein